MLMGIQSSGSGYVAGKRVVAGSTSVGARHWYVDVKE
jgi:hypothetical protein